MKNKGQESIEFVLITLLVFFGALFTLLIFSEKIAGFFQGGSSAVKVSTNNPKLIDPNAPPKYDFGFAKGIKAGDFNGKLTDPITECENNYCNIDFGTFALNNVPVDINEVIESSGSSGGTSEVANVLDQINKQLPDLPSLNQTENFLLHHQLRIMSMFGHNLANYEDMLDNNAEWYSDYYKRIDNMGLIEKGQKVHYEPISQVVKSGTLNFKLSLREFNGLLENPTTDEEKAIKSLVNHLATQIEEIAAEQTKKADELKGFNTTPEEIDELLNMKASLRTHFKSGIICATGKGIDSGKECAE